MPDSTASTRWSVDSITDDSFRARFVIVPRILEEWVGKLRPSAGWSVLDFGCGEGITALALALKHDARVVGVDIMPDPERCLPVARAQLGLNALPANLHLARVLPGSLHDDDDRFDFVYSWSVFEHVDRRVLPGVLSRIRSCLRPDGLFFVQIAPLYYSAEGSHLFHKLPEPWAHLLRQHNELHDELAATTRDDAELRELWSTYRTLNRITAEELVDLVSASGFEIVRTHYTQDDHKPPARLRAIYQPEVLTTNQIALLARVDRR
jgi:cyclopropane fatty-acyl-phospholipid synthase-like methyltransferase